MPNFDTDTLKFDTGVMNFDALYLIKSFVIYFIKAQTIEICCYIDKESSVNIILKPHSSIVKPSQNKAAL